MALGHGVVERGDHATHSADAGGISLGERGKSFPLFDGVGPVGVEGEEEQQ
jgi:hypothetical protein